MLDVYWDNTKDNENFIEELQIFGATDVFQIFCHDILSSKTINLLRLIPLFLKVISSPTNGDLVRFDNMIVWQALNKLCSNFQTQSFFDIVLMI